MRFLRRALTRGVLLWQAQGGARGGTYAYRGPLDALSTIVRKARRTLHPPSWRAAR